MDGTSVTFITTEVSGWSTGLQHKAACDLTSMFSSIALSNKRD